MTNVESHTVTGRGLIKQQLFAAYKQRQRRQPTYKPQVTCFCGRRFRTWDSLSMHAAQMHGSGN